MGALKNTVRADVDAALADLPGVEFQHDVHLAVADWAAWTAVSERIAATGADVHALQLARSDGGFSVRCRLSRVSAGAARGLLDALLNEGVAERGSVEHVALVRGVR